MSTRTGQSRRGKGRRWRSALYLGVTSALLLELALRVWSQFPSDSRLFVSDRQVGFRFRPLTQVRRHLTNSRGFNDVEHPSTPAPGARRIAFIGDSFVFGVVARTENLVSVFDRRINEGEKRFEVLNMGIPAAGPENYLGVLEHDARQLAPDTIFVVFFVGNDVFQSHPDFRTRVWFGGPRAKLSSPFLLKPSADYVYSLKLLRAGWRLARNRLADGLRAADGRLSEDAFLDVERRSLEICLREQPERVAPGYRGAAELVARMKRASDADGRRLLVILAPDRFQVEAELRSRLISKYGLDAARYDFDQPQRILTDAFESRGVEVLDLLPAFRRQGATARLHRPRDTHWNARGNELAAESILEHFLATMDDDDVEAAGAHQAPPAGRPMAEP